MLEQWQSPNPIPGAPAGLETTKGHDLETRWPWDLFTNGDLGTDLEESGGRARAAHSAALAEIIDICVTTFGHLFGVVLEYGHTPDPIPRAPTCLQHTHIGFLLDKRGLQNISLRKLVVALVSFRSGCVFWIGFQFFFLNFCRRHFLYQSLSFWQIPFRKAFLTSWKNHNNSGNFSLTYHSNSIPTGIHHYNKNPTRKSIHQPPPIIPSFWHFIPPSPIPNLKECSGVTSTARAPSCIDEIGQFGLGHLLRVRFEERHTPDTVAGALACL